MAFSSWIRNWKRSIERRWALYQTIRRKSASRRLANRPRVEALEDRWLLSTYIVTNTNDSGSGSLRDAINQANNTTSGITEIDFNIGTKGTPSGVQTISPASALPTLTANGVFINGYSETQWQGATSTSPLIELNGAGAGNVDGLFLTGNNNTVSGLWITGFVATDLELGGSNNVVGGTTAGAGNVFSSSTSYGVIIDGGATGNLVQGNYVGTNEAGNGAMANYYGFFINGANNTIGGTASGAGNVISGNTAVGVYLNAGGNLVQGNYIGTNAAGTGSVANGVGITVTSSGNTIDGGNVISGNSSYGVDVEARVTLQGNYIGTNAAGTGSVANSIGVHVGTSGAIIGSPTSGSPNVISGNNYGISINANNVTVENNFIGTDHTGANPLGNSIDGILIAGSNNTVGIGNLISANSNAGVEVSTGAGNTVAQNSIFANGGAGTGPGIIVDSGANNNVAAPSISSASITGYALTVQGSFTAATANVPYVLQFYGSPNGDAEGKAYIGSLTVTPTGTGTQNFTYNATTTVPRTYPLITATLTDNTGSTSAFSNGVDSTTIYVVTSGGDTNTSGTLRYAITQANNTSSGITTIDFAIGTPGSAQTISLTSALPALTANNVFINGLSQGGLSNTTQLITLDGTKAGSGTDGLLLKGSSDAVSGLIVQNFSKNGIEVAGANNTVGGNAAAGQGNVLSSNTTDGVLIDSGVSGNQVQGNFIGTDITGSKAAANSIGVEVGGSNNTIGGIGSGTRNVISGNTTDGVLIDSTASGVSVQGNYIGTDVTGAKALANGTYGIDVEGSSNVIGGSVAGAGNVISGNTSDGVHIGSAVSGVAVQGNFVGTDYTGLNPLGNSGNGINIAGNKNTVGAGNVISANSKNGVLVSSGSGNTITQNSIFSNTGLGISLASGANNNIAAPSISSASVTGYTLTVKGSFTAATANVPYVLEFFGSANGDAEGKAFITSVTVTPTGTGTQNFNFTFTTTVPRVYPLITATVTDNSGNTSQFSNGVTTGNVYVVTSAADSGSGTLRDAITQANNTTSGITSIDFAIGSTGSAQTINLASALPTLTANNVFINGLSQGGLSNTTQLITLNGSGAGSGSDGLLLQGSSGVVEGLIIENFTKNGVEVAGASNTVGGSSTGQGNVLSGNTNDGLLIDSAASGVQVQGNFIGTDITGTNIVANSVGIEVAGSNNIIGGTTSGARNLISGNTLDGVLTDNGASGNQVLGNYIGTNVNGTSPAPQINFPNGFASSGNFFTYNNGASLNGNYLEVTDGNGNENRSIFTTNQISITHFTTTWTQNMSSPATADGMTFCIQTDGNNVVGGAGGSLGYQGLGKSVAIKFDLYNNSGEGTDSTGLFTDGANPTVPAIDLTPSGINLHSGDDMQVTLTYDGTNLTETINDPTAKATFTHTYTINIAGTVGSNTAYIGFTGGTGGAAFTGLIKNWTYATQTSIGNGVGVSVNGANNTIGGNIIAGNTGAGLQISGSGATVQGNNIGVDVSGATAAANGSGILVTGNNNTIGGTAAGASNVISANTGDGVQIGKGASGVLLLGNYIGTDHTGANALGNKNGIEIAGSNNTVGGTATGARNIISGNSNDGILLDSTATGNQVLNSYIGTNATGIAALANSVGIEDAGSSNTLGGTVSGARNLVSGNTSDGVLLDSGASSNVVLGNYIGTNVGGTTALSNSIGIEVAGNSNTIGGSASGSRNLLSGNSGDGVLLDKSASGNLVLGNAIGSNTNDTAALGNSGNGIEIAGTLNTIGGSVSGATNEISGNSKDGLLLDSTASGNQVLGNFIGTDHTGLKALANSVGIEDAGSSNTLGGSAAFGDRNIISGNTNDGILLDSTAKAESVEDNYIGLNNYGNAALANGSNGVEVMGAANTIGGNSGSNHYLRNFISGNTKDGVLIDSGASGNVVQGNWIGLGTSGTQGVANVNGIEIAGTSNTIGGSVSGLSNIISGNSNDGVLIDSTGANNVIQGNYAGPDYTGQKALANSVNGIEIAGTGNTVGGTVSAARNILSGNSKDGVKIDSGASSNVVLGNYIGTNVGGTTALSNSTGIEIAGNSNTIGGSASGARNVISGNTGDGVLIDSTGSGNLVLGNAIGCNTYDTAALGNSGNGIEIAGTLNTIGGSVSGATNQISSNSNAGVFLDSTASGNVVLGNYIGTDHTGLNARANKTGIEDAGSSNTLGGSAAFSDRNVIAANTNDGILLDSSAKAESVEDNYIGLNAYGNAALANGTNGVEVLGTANTIGGNTGTSRYFRNFISGNTKDGVLIDSGASGNVVQGNWIGLGTSGTQGVANVNGIEIGGSSNTIGGAVSGLSNVLSGNSNDGVLIDSTGANNVIQGNYAGPDYTGQKALANSVNGIEVAGTGNTVGGTASGARNILSGNSKDGVKIDSGASSNVVLGNYIGTNVGGTTALSNSIGIEVAGNSNTIGGSASGSRNLLSGNTGDGVLIDSTGSGNLVLGNAIGSNTYDTAALGNSGNGIEIAGTLNTIGGSVSGATNQISSNSNDGILLDSTSSGNQVLGNFIGTDHTGLNARANKTGIEDAGSGNTLGGSVSGARNIISGNTNDGILLDSGVTKDVVQGNYIGLNNYGNAALANGSNGVEVMGTANTIGGNSGTNHYVRNYISGNGNAGVLIDSAGSGNLVQGNWIGLGSSGTQGVANVNGIEIAGSNNTIGGSASGSTNVVSGNKNDGVRIDSTGANNLLQGNYVGTDYTGTKPLGNSANGVEISGNNNTVGGSASGAGNIISGNGKSGVLISAGSGDTISRNSIFGNTGLGISLASGANNNIGAPTLTNATLSGTTLTVTGTFNAPTANVTYVLEFFANPSGDAEGKIFLGFLSVTPTTTGTQNFSFVTTTTVTGTNPLITATLTDNLGDTSEFSNGVTVS